LASLEKTQRKDEATDDEEYGYRERSLVEQLQGRRSPFFRRLGHTSVTLMLVPGLQMEEHIEVMVKKNEQCGETTEAIKKPIGIFILLLWLFLLFLF